MKKLLCLLGLILGQLLTHAAGPPPVLRNSFTTNADPQALSIVTNIATNAAAVVTNGFVKNSFDTNIDSAVFSLLSTIYAPSNSPILYNPTFLGTVTNTASTTNTGDSFFNNLFANFVIANSLTVTNGTNINLIVSNAVAQWMFVNNLTVTNGTNINLSVSNLNALYATFNNWYATNATNINLLVSNAVAQWIFVNNLTVTNGTNINLSASNVYASYFSVGGLNATNATNFILYASNAYRLSTSTTFATNEYVTADYVQGFLTREIQLYFRASITNTATNACWLLSDTFNPTNTTNTSYLMTNNQYAATFLATNQQVQAISDGNATIDFDASTTVGTATIRPELYLTTNGVTDIEFAEGNQIAITTTRAHFISLIVIPTNVVVLPGTFLKVTFKTLALTGSPRLQIFTGSNAVSGITLPAVALPQPLFSTLFDLGTNQTDSTTLTNHIADFNLQYSDLFATNDLNFIQSTNRLAGKWQSAVFKIYTGPTNRQIWLNSNWSLIGSAATNYTVLASNKVAILSLGQDGSSETNVSGVLVVQP